MTTRAGGRKKKGAPGHDRGYRRLFSHPESVEELLRGFVEEDWVDGLDFSSLEKVDPHFVGDDFGGRASDCSVLRRTYKGVIIPDDFDLEDAPMLEESARKWEKRFLREGRVEGARDMLLQLLQQRFGPLPKAVRSQIKAIDSPETLKLLGQRVLEAKSLEDLRIGQTSRRRNPAS